MLKREAGERAAPLPSLFGGGAYGFMERLVRLCRYAGGSIDLHRQEKR